MNKIILIPLIFAVASFAAADSILTQQRDALKELQVMDTDNPGVLVTGDFKSGANSVMLDADGEDLTEINAFTQANIEFQARPTAETRAKLLFRVHQDWQKSRDEGLSPFLFRWISYDGRAWNKRIDFNLGDMRVAYTPLTMFTPDLGLKNEPEIFAQRRKDIMEYNNIDGSNARLLQGLNFSMHSGKVAFFNDLYLQATGSRLRAQGKKPGLVIFDIDYTDRFMIAGRGGFDIKGIALEGAHVYTFSREKTAENSGFINDAGGEILLEDNGVTSGTLNINIAELAGMNNWKLNIGAELAKSWYKSQYLKQVESTEKKATRNTTKVFINGEEQLVNNIIYETFRVTDTEYFSGPLTPGDKEFAVHGLLEVGTPKNITDMQLKVRFVQNGKDFISELAQSPNYFAKSILNASALSFLYANNPVLEDLPDGNLPGGTLENLYFAVYNNNPLTQLSMTGVKSQPSGVTNGHELLNNYKKAHFLRSGFSSGTLTPAELAELRSPENLALLDPAINLSMPFGLATPDRTGALLDVEWAFLDNKISINANGGYIMQGEDLTTGEKAPSFMDFGGGFSVDAGRFAGLSKPLTVQAGFEGSIETDGYERSYQSAKAGLRWGIWRSLSLLGGFGMVMKDYGTFTALESTEMMFLAGPEVKLAEGAYFNAQYGMLNTEYKKSLEATFNRNIITADVRIKF